MITAFILIIIGLLAAAALVQLVRTGKVAATGSDSTAKAIHPVDLRAFRNLVDPEEEEFLRANLTAAQFRSLRRERLRTALEYISRAAQNAKILMRMGEAARLNPDASIAEAGEKLADSALHLRLYAFQATAKLYLAILVPGTNISPVRITENYERMTRLVVLLGCLRYPTNGVAAGL